jgi:hypothetical protein
VDPAIGRAQHLIRRGGERHMIGHYFDDLADLDGHHFRDRRLDRALSLQRPEAAARLNVARLPAPTDRIHRLLAGQPIPHRDPP